MPNYRRNYIAGGTYFFTVVTSRRVGILTTPPALTILRACMRAERRRRPFVIDAAVILPDHLHMIWSMPHGDADYSRRWSAIKSDFTRRWLAVGGSEQPVSRAQSHEMRRGVWQPRFMEHTIRDEDDLIHHVEYIHFNPVKHGLVRCPGDWQHSSFHRYVRQGIYDSRWGCLSGKTPDLTMIDASLVE